MYWGRAGNCDDSGEVLIEAFHTLKDHRVRIAASCGGASDLDKDLLTVEGIDHQPADEDEPQRVEQRGEGCVGNYAVNGAVESLLQVDARAGADVVDRRGQQFGEDVGRDRIGTEDEQRREDA